MFDSHLDFVYLRSVLHELRSEISQTTTTEPKMKGSQMTGQILPSLPLSFQKLLESLVPWLSPFHMHRTQGRRPDLNLICEISPSRTCAVPKCCHPALQPLCSSDSPLHYSLARLLPPPAHCQCQVTTAPGSPLTTLPQPALQKLLPLVFTIQVWGTKEYRNHETVFSSLWIWDKATKVAD